MTGGAKAPLFVVHDALRDVRMAPGEPLPMFTARRAKIPESRAVDYAERLAALAAAFVAVSLLRLVF